MRKLFSIILIAALLVTSAVPVFGSNTPESAELERAIRQVRAVIEIPSAASIFEHSSWDDGQAGRTWNLMWRSDNWEISYNVTVDSAGRIINFFSHYSNMQAGGDMTRAQGQLIAEDFLQRVAPTSIEDFKLLDSHADLHSFTYSFVAYMNDFPVRDWVFTLTVNKATERVSGYFSSMGATDDITFTVPDEIISAAEAKQAFLESGNIALMYNSSFDWNTQQLTIFPSFVLNSQNFVDAGSGEMLTPPNFPAQFGGAGAFGMVNDAAVAQERELTPPEREAVEGLAGVISREQAIRTATSTVPGLTASSELLSAGLSVRHDDRSRHVWHLQFENSISVTVDANANRLLSFFDFGWREPGTTLVAADVAERTAREFISRVAAREMEQAELFESMSTLEIQPIQRDMGFLYRFVFVRNVNGIPFPGNSISVSVEPSSGRVVQFDLTWGANLQFPAIGDTISLEEVFNIYAASLDFELFYVVTANNEMTLVYGFRNWAGFTVDPVTGMRLGFDGNEFREHRVVTSYDDIAGRWYESAVTSLLDKGYFLAGTSFNGSAQITQYEFLRFLHSPWGFTTQDNFYDWMVSGGIILREEIAPDRIITRQEAARIAIRFLGLQRAARDSSIFINPFTDAVPQGFLGYAALARALGIMTGDTAGNFNGSQNLTRAQAAVVINNLLRVQ